MFDACPNPQVQRSIRWLFLGSGVLFLATVVLGFVNVFSPSIIPHAQVLAHFHSGSIGWVTLSVIAATLWAFTAGRDPGEGVANFASLVAGIGTVAVAGYIAAFGLAFSGNGPYWMLPLFGIPSGLVIIAAFIFTLQQRRHITWTPPHLLLSGALLVASLGATMGILIGLAHSEIVDAFPAAADKIGSHAGPMDMYLALAFGALAERLLGGSATLTRWAKTQVALGVLSGFVISAALFTGTEPLIPVALLLFLASFVIFFVRIGHRGFRHGFGDGIRSATTFGTLFFPVYILVFVYLVATYFSQGLEPPKAWLVLFPHVTFVGMATNLLLATHARFSDATGGLRLSIIVLNIGLVLFIAGTIAADDRYAAIIMGLGILMAWIIVMRAHWAARGQGLATGV